MAERSQRRAARIALHAAGILVVLAVLVLAARKVDFHEVWQALRQANPFLLFTAVPALLVLNFVLRSARFHALVQALPAPAVPFRLIDSGKSLLSSQAANNLVPLRLGELVRTRDLVKRGYDLPHVVVAQVAEKSVEAATLGACALPLVPLGLVQLPRLPGGMWAAVAVGAAGVIALAAFVLWRRRSGQRERKLSLSPKAIARCAAWSLAADLVECVLIAVTLVSLGISPSARACLAVYVGINLAISVPSTPAQLGAFEAGGAIALVLFGVSVEQAVAFSLLYRVVQWAPATLIGGFVWLAPARDKPVPEAAAAAPGG